MATYKTPNVYVEEISVFPPSVAEVETAIPAFIGFTASARKAVDDDLRLKPTRIKSLMDYEQYFGKAKEYEIKVDVKDDGSGGFTADVKEPAVRYILHYCMRSFFDNGGGPCYVVSIGSDAAPIATDSFEKGLTAVRKEE